MKAPAGVPVTYPMPWWAGCARGRGAILGLVVAFLMGAAASCADEGEGEGERETVYCEAPEATDGCPFDKNCCTGRGRYYECECRTDCMTLSCCRWEESTVADTYCAFVEGEHVCTEDLSLLGTGVECGMDVVEGGECDPEVLDACCPGSSSVMRCSCSGSACQWTEEFCGDVACEGVENPWE